MKFARIENVIGLVFFLSFGFSGCGGGSSAPPAPPTPPISVVVSPASANVPQSGTQPFNAVVSNAGNTAVNWKVQEAGGGSISTTGVYTAPNAAGTFHVVATSQADSTKTATATVSVPSVSVAINPQTSILTLSGTRIFAATVTGTINTAVTWMVQEGLAGGAIDASGNYTAPSTVGTFHVLATSTSDQSASGIATVTVVQSSFAPTGSMESPRVAHTATLLTDGKVLLTGGFTDAAVTVVASAELFDRSTGKFVATADMETARAAHTASQLLDGRVLIAGGFTTDACNSTLGSAELFDPATGMFTPTGDMTALRFGHTATTLKNGQVLVVGGDDVSGDPLNGCSSFIHSTAELYDPATGSFSNTGSMLTPRFGHTATLLPDGKVLIAGGFKDGPTSETLASVATAELYDPSTGTFAPTGRMSTPRARHTASVLPDGKVLIAGGLDPFAQPIEVLASAELYDPGTGAFTSTGSMENLRWMHAATLLSSGQVLITGGADSLSAEVFDPVSGIFSVTVSMTSIRSGHTATLLQNGQVLITGGSDEGGNALATAEVYQQ